MICINNEKDVYIENAKIYKGITPNVIKKTTEQNLNNLINVKKINKANNANKKDKTVKNKNVNLIRENKNPMKVESHLIIINLKKYKISKNKKSKILIPTEK